MRECGVLGIDRQQPVPCPCSRYVSPGPDSGVMLAVLVLAITAATILAVMW